MVGAPFEIRTSPQVDAQFSIPYTVAAALTRGKVLLGDFSSDTITKGTSVLELAKKIKVVIDPKLPVNDISSANMTVRMVSGETLSSRVDGLKGSPSKPMSFDECARKFRDCLEYSGKPGLVENGDFIVDFIFNLEKKDDVNKIFEYV
jgi:2-methylcitrate dehydratase PrpD